MAALSVGAEIIELRRLAPPLGVTTELEGALQDLASGNSVMADAGLRELENRLLRVPDTVSALRARGGILIISEALAEHAAYFDTGASI